MPNNKETSLDAVRSITRPSGPSAHLKPTSKIARQALRARGPRAGTRRRNKVASQSGFMMPCAKLMLRWPVAITALLALALSAASATAADPAAAAAKPRPRARDLGVPFDGTPGPLNAITDVDGVLVGHTTLISGSGKLVVGKGPVRTGVTVIHPRGKANSDPVFAAWFTLNGNGEMTGTTWVQESGLLEGPVAITNTHSVGVVRDAIIQWEVSQKTALQPWWLPVVAETYDGALNDINGFHVKPEHVVAALDRASGGVPQEGAVGGGTGMVCHG